MQTRIFNCEWIKLENLCIAKEVIPKNEAMTNEIE